MYVLCKWTKSTTYIAVFTNPVFAYMIYMYVVYVLCVDRYICAYISIRVRIPMGFYVPSK